MKNTMRASALPKMIRIFSDLFIAYTCLATRIPPPAFASNDKSVEGRRAWDAVACLVVQTLAAAAQFQVFRVTFKMLPDSDLDGIQGLYVAEYGSEARENISTIVTAAFKQMDIKGRSGDEEVIVLDITASANDDTNIDVVSMTRIQCDPKAVAALWSDREYLSSLVTNPHSQCVRALK